MIYLSSKQYAYIAQTFVRETYGETQDIKNTFEVIGEGLDANLTVVALAYEGEWGFTFFFIELKLETYDPSGVICANDFDAHFFEAYYREFS